MALRRVAVIGILIIYLYGAYVKAANLPILPGNRLAEGADRDLPNASPIRCGASQTIQGTMRGAKNPSQALTSANFGKYVFTSGPIGHPQSPRPGHEAKFKYSEVRARNTLYALAVDESGESAYWLPQGGTIDIPHTPSATQPRYVFTPDFSGCSWTVTPMSNGNLRLRHVEGGKEGPQFNNLSNAQKGGTTTYAMQYKDYGFIVETRQLTSNVPALAYMHFSGGRWTLYVQQKTCAPQPGGYVFTNRRLTGMTVLETGSNGYPNIYGTKSWSIP